MQISSRIDRRILFKGKWYYYFSGTAYLGMGSLPEFESKVIAGIEKYGPSYGASRFSNVQLSVYEEMEYFFAKKAEAEKALVLSSGLLAGYLSAGVLKNISNRVWVAPDAHPAILAEGIGPEGQQDFDQFKNNCIARSHKLHGEIISIFSNSVNPLKPLVYNFEWVRELSDKNTYYLLLDDSHAFGLLGKGVFGTYSQYKNLPINLIISGSLNKALAIPAGIILGPASFMEKIASNPVFIGASPPAPASCHAFLEAQGLYEFQQQKLRKNMEFFFSRIQAFPGLRYQEDFPVAIFNSNGWAEKLKEKQVLVSSFPYPSPQDATLDRIILSAYHEIEDLKNLVNILKSV